MANNNILYFTGPGTRVGFESTDLGIIDVMANTVFQASQVSIGPVIGGLTIVTADPMFVDPGAGDYRLLAGSPSVDAGENAAVPSGMTTDWNGMPRFVDDPDTVDTGFGTAPIVDHGAFERQAEVTPCPGDLNNDGFVDDSDFTIFVVAYNILDCNDGAMPAGCPADLNGDDFVDDSDFQIFVVAYNELLCP